MAYFYLLVASPNNIFNLGYDDCHTWTNDYYPNDNEEDPNNPTPPFTDEPVEGLAK